MQKKRERSPFNEVIFFFLGGGEEGALNAAFDNRKHNKILKTYNP